MATNNVTIGKTALIPASTSVPRRLRRNISTTAIADCTRICTRLGVAKLSSTSGIDPWSERWTFAFSDPDRGVGAAIVEFVMRLPQGLNSQGGM